MELWEFGAGKTWAINYFFIREVADEAKDERAKWEAQTWNEFTEKRRWIAKRKLKDTKSRSLVQKWLGG